MADAFKQGHRRKNWKVRLFVLRSEPAFLHYFDPTKVSERVTFDIGLMSDLRCESGVSV